MPSFMFFYCFREQKDIIYLNYTKNIYNNNNNNSSNNNNNNNNNVDFIHPSLK